MHLLRRSAFLFSVALSAGSILAQQTGELPADKAADVCPDTLLSVTFNGTPSVGAAGQVRIYDAADNKLVDTLDVGIPPTSQNYTLGGEVGFHYYPVLIDGNTATIYPHHQVLEYKKAYYVQMDPGVLRVKDGDFAGISGNTAWTFSTKAAPPASTVTRLVVAADGTGDFATVQGAVDFVHTGEHPPVTIFIRKGVYREIVYFDRKADLTFLGEDRAQTIITYANNDRFNNRAATNERPTTNAYHRGMFFANHSTGIELGNLTLRNTTPHGGSQAEALILTGNHNIVRNTSLSSYQDTVQFNGPTYVADCDIEGDTDYLWGRGPAYFINCELKCLTSRAPYMQIRNTAANHGFVFVDCTFSAPSGVAGVTFARINPATYPYSEVVLIDCKLGDHISPAAWRLDGNSTATENIHFWESTSTNLSDGKPADVSQRASYAKQLTKENAAETIANYRNPEFVLGWTPVPPSASSAKAPPAP